jgi:hypothetical protein
MHRRFSFFLLLTASAALSPRAASILPGQTYTVKRGSPLFADNYGLHVNGANAGRIPGHHPSGVFNMTADGLAFEAVCVDATEELFHGKTQLYYTETRDEYSSLNGGPSFECKPAEDIAAVVHGRVAICR